MKAFFLKQWIKKQEAKRESGRGSQKQSKVLVLIESKPIDLENEADSNKPNRIVGHVKMIVMENLRGDTINSKVAQSVDDKAEAITDSYNG